MRGVGWGLVGPGARGEREVANGVEREVESEEREFERHGGGREAGKDEGRKVERVVCVGEREGAGAVAGVVRVVACVRWVDGVDVGERGHGHGVSESAAWEKEVDRDYNYETLWKRDGRCGSGQSDGGVRARAQRRGVGRSGWSCVRKPSLAMLVVV